MILIELDPDALSPLPPAQREQRELAYAGQADGAAGRTRRSDAAAYGRAYILGALKRQAHASEVVLAVQHACGCYRCGLVYEWRGPGRCGGQHLSEPLVEGYTAFWGEIAADDDLEFFTMDTLRRLIRQGIPVFHLDGECLNPQILMQ